MSQTMQAISVRRRLTPLKQSKKEDPTSAAFSSSLVWCIMATCFLAKSSGTPETSFLTAASASANRPFRVNHQGLYMSKCLHLLGWGNSRLGSEEDTDEDGDGPNPLNRERNLVRPLGRVVDQSPVDTGADNLADNPAEVDVGSKERSDLDRHDLGGVRYSHGLEGTPGETEKDVTGEKHLEVDGEELDEEETGKSDKSSHHGRSVPVSFGGPSSDLKTENLTDLYGYTETDLPLRGDLVIFVHRVVFTESLCESLVGVELIVSTEPPAEQDGDSLDPRARYRSLP